MINGHGDDIHHYTLPITSNFSSNVYCGIDHQELFQRLGSKISCVCNYPEPVPVTLETAFADFFQVTGESVCVTNGATEAIYLIAQAFRGRKSAVWAPTFSEYADACRLHHHRISYFYTYDSLPADAEVVWLCNPNNPTGEVRTLSKLKNWIACNPHKLFVIDQSYEAFTLHPLYSVYEAAALPNVLLIHSLTKHFAIPGLRIGYLTGHPEILRDIRVQRMPWSVNALAIEAGFYALEQHLSLPFDLVSYLNEKEKFAWWTMRLNHALETYDIVRIDHFRGIDRYYEIPAFAENATKGEWKAGPGKKLFAGIGDRSRFIAEDLGIMDEGVVALREELGFPGMKVMLFAFDGNPKNDFLPANIPENSVCYTGTHDNDTVAGYVKSLSAEDLLLFRSRVAQALQEQKKFIRLGKRPEEISEALCKLVLSTKASLAVLPVQDILGLDNSARMNRPSTEHGNWCFRLERMPKGGIMHRLKRWIRVYRR